MKVLVVGTGGALGGSGITTSADQTFEALQGLGHEPIRLVAGSRHRPRPNRVNVENVTAVFRESLEVALAVRRHRPDVVWMHTFGVPTLPALRTLAQVLAARVGCRSVVVRFQAFALEGHIANAGRLQRAVLRAVAASSARLVAEHDRAAAALATVGGRERVITLSNWVEVPAHPAALPEGGPVVALYVGGLITRKGVPELIEAVRELDDRVLLLRLIGGPGDEGQGTADAIRRSADDLVADGSVEFLGPLSGPDVRQELARAHLFILPSRAEGMPLAMLEALAEGRAVVVSQAGNMPDIVRRHGCGVVLSNVDPACIAQQLRLLIEDPVQLVELGRRAHAAAEAEFSPAAVGVRLEQILAAAVR